MKIGGCLSQNLAIAISLFNSPLIFLALTYLPPPRRLRSLSVIVSFHLLALTPTNIIVSFLFLSLSLSLSLSHFLRFFLLFCPCLLLILFSLQIQTKLKHVRFPFLVSKYQDRNMFKLQSYSLFSLLLYIIYNLFC